MLVEELDGFVAGIVCCPELIQPGEWLPVVWGRTDDESSVFENLDHAQRVIPLVMGHYNHVAVTLSKTPENYRPLFAEDDRNGDILWEIWIEGFEKAMKLRPTAWHEKQAKASAEGSSATIQTDDCNYPGIYRASGRIVELRVFSLWFGEPEHENHKLDGTLSGQPWQNHHLCLDADSDHSELIDTIVAGRMPESRRAYS
jgi:hypothetical protein